MQKEAAPECRSIIKHIKKKKGLVQYEIARTEGCDTALRMLKRKSIRSELREELVDIAEDG
jgi:hypothetical protein